MEITIEKTIDVLEYLKTQNSQLLSLDVALETMRKYQKIEEIYDYWRSGKCEYTISCMENIGKVLRDGHVD